jgi:hypothetical protein
MNLDDEVDLGMGQTKPLRDCTAHDLTWAVERAKRQIERLRLSADALNRRDMANVLCEVEIAPGVWCDEQAVAVDPTRQAVPAALCAEHYKALLIASFKRAASS